MALIKCPECQSDVSDRAHSCPKCGCPVSGSPSLSQTEKTQLIEQTSKKYKAHRLFSTIAMIAGFLMLVTAFAGSPTGSPAPILGWIGLTGMVTGLVWGVWAGFLIWWHHQ